VHVDGDTFFPEIDTQVWNMVSSKQVNDLIFCIYESTQSTNK
jgi:dihydrofolate reductase